MEKKFGCNSLMECTDCTRETTYLITSEKVGNTGVRWTEGVPGDIIEEFSAEDDEAATAYAEEQYADIEWCDEGYPGVSFQHAGPMAKRINTCKRHTVTVYLNTRWRGIRHGRRKNAPRNFRYRLAEMEVRLSSCFQPKQCKE